MKQADLAYLKVMYYSIYNFLSMTIYRAVTYKKILYKGLLFIVLGIKFLRRNYCRLVCGEMSYLLLRWDSCSNGCGATLD